MFFLTILIFGMCSVPFSSAGLLKKTNDVFYLKKYIHQQIGIQPTRYTLGSIFGGFRAHKRKEKLSQNYLLEKAFLRDYRKQVSESKIHKPHGNFRLLGK